MRVGVPYAAPRQAESPPTPRVKSTGRALTHGQKDSFSVSGGVQKPPPEVEHAARGDAPRTALALRAQEAARSVTPLGFEQALDEALGWLALCPVEALSDAQLEAFTQKMPKVDLHRHLEGSIEPETLLAIAEKHGIALPADTVEDLTPFLQITDKDKTLLDFLSKFNTVGKVFKNAEVISDITTGVIRDLGKDAIPYAELRFSPLYMAESHGLDPEEVTRAVLEGVKRATSDGGPTVRLILIVERQLGVEPAELVRGLAEKYQAQGVVALDLANDEFNYPPGPYASVFQRAKKAGLKVTVHAGEAGGADNVRTAIEELHADRIGHGVRTFEDPAVEKLVRERKIALECCPTSNVQTGATASLASHPLDRYRAQGLQVTVNTDDPSISGITLSEEFAKVARQFGGTLTDLTSLVESGAEAAFLPAAEKAQLKATLQRGAKEALHHLGTSMPLEKLRELAHAGLMAQNSPPPEQKRDLLRLEQVFGILSLAR